MPLPNTRDGILAALETEYQRAFNGVTPRASDGWTLVRAVCLLARLQLLALAHEKSEQVK